MTRCPQKPFGCDCGPHECRSLAVRLEDHAKRYDEAVVKFQNAWFRALCAAMTTICLAGLLALAALSAEEQFKRQDRDRQELTAQWRMK
jgi:hypothetical protein